jgi:hypothetical protein
MSLAGHDLSAAQATGAPITMGALEIGGLPDDAENHDLLLLDISEVVQNIFSDATLIGRLDACSFGLVMLSEERHFSSRLDRFGNELQKIRNTLRVLGATVAIPEKGPCDLEALFSETQMRRCCGRNAHRCTA